MHVLIVYYSRTGNTQHMAEAIATGVREVDGVDCVLKTPPETTNDDLMQCDGLILGSPVYFGSMAAPIKQVVDGAVPVRKKMADKVGGAFVSGGDPSGGRETTLISMLEALLIMGMVVVGDPLDASGHYGPAAVGSPDRRTLEGCRKHGARVARLAKKMHAKK